MSEARKLRRGLKDVSPLFGDLRSVAPAPAAKDGAIEPLRPLQAAAVFAAGLPIAERLKAGAYLASRVPSGIPSSVVAVGEHPDEFQDGSSVFYPWERVGALAPLGRTESGPRLLFVHFDWHRSAEKLVGLLDRCILWMAPDAENVTEAYKTVKYWRALNGRLEFLFLYRGAPQDARHALLFERFSGVVSRELGVQLLSLGALEWTDGASRSAAIDLEPLLWPPADPVPSLEKQALGALAAGLKAAS